MCVCVLSRFSHVLLFVTLCSVALQVLLSLGVSRQKYCSGLHVLLQGMLLTQGSNPNFLCLLLWHTGSLLLAPPGKPEVCL